MNKFLFTITACVALYGAAFSQGLKTPAPSPSTIVKQDFALSSVEISYSRPGVKGRKIFGDLVPYGNVWRTGANGATTITFGEEVNIGGTTIAAGKYGLLTIPDKNEWTIIITKQTNVNSPSLYDQSNDIVRVKVKPKKLPYTVESFMIAFDNIKSTSMDVAIVWENTVVFFPITTDIDSKVMSQIDEQMKTDKPPYFQAAMYYVENGKDLNKALEWIDKTIETTPAFWAYHQKARVLGKLGKKSEAITAAQKSMELAKEAKNSDYVTLNEKLLASLK